VHDQAENLLLEHQLAWAILSNGDFGISPHAADRDPSVSVVTA
jgi:hypothetical protein